MLTSLTVTLNLSVAVFSLTETTLNFLSSRAVAVRAASSPRVNRAAVIRNVPIRHLRLRTVCCKSRSRQRWDGHTETGSLLKNTIFHTIYLLDYPSPVFQRCSNNLSIPPWSPGVYGGELAKYFATMILYGLSRDFKQLHPVLLFPSAITFLVYLSRQYITYCFLTFPAHIGQPHFSRPVRGSWANCAGHPAIPTASPISFACNRISTILAIRHF